MEFHQKKSDAVERVLTRVGNVARGRDDFHIVPDLFPLLVVVGEQDNKWDDMEVVLTARLSVQ